MGYSPTRSGRYLNNTSALRTTDATATVLKNLPVYPGRAIKVVIDWMASQEDSEEFSSGTIKAWYEDVSGTATIIGAQDLETFNYSSVIGTVALAASGGNVVLTATGTASTNIRWFADFDVKEVVTPA